MLFFERDIAVDLGTMATRMYVQGKGIRLREATVIAMDKNNGRVLRMGEDARKILGRTPANIVSVHPIVNGVISDYDMTSRMLRDFFSRVTSFSLFKPRVLILVPGSISGVEERAVIDAVIEGGARKVYLLESSVATAVGAGVDVKKPDGHLVVDIGAGTTETAVISVGGVAFGRSIKTAGNAMDEAIVKYIRQKHNLAIGLSTAESLKKTIGCAMELPEALYDEAKGRCLLTGLPKTVSVSSSDIAAALKAPLKEILDSIHYTLEHTEPELVNDISNNGIILAGGGSLLRGLPELIGIKTGMEAIVVDDPVSCNAYGAGRILYDLEEMTEGMINLARRKQILAAD